MEVAVASGVTVEIRAAAVPLFEGVLPFVASHRPGGMASNRQHFGARVAMPEGLARDLQDLLYDPQTSGGLLVAVPSAHLKALEDALGERNVPFWHIGRVIEQDPARPILVV